MTVFLIYLLPLALPTAIYVLWRLWRARVSPAGAPAPDGTTSAPAAEPIDWREVPWLWLILAGGVLLAAVLLTGVFTHGAPDHGQYTPPHLEDGRIVPGELRPEGGGQSGTASPP